MKKLFPLLGVVLLTACFQNNDGNNGTSQQSSASSVVFCTMDAKICPDGSAVGRVPPDCEFEACPDTSDNSVSDGVIAFTLSENFALAVTEEQILTQSNIPPCDSGFTYCLYYNGLMYSGTNLETAGLSIAKRPTLSSQEDCLQTPPEGYIESSPTIYEGTGTRGYATSVFAPLGDAAAGHYSTGALYRLYTEGSCYAFQTRIGQTQFANYPSGSITEFTDEDEAQLRAEVQALLAGVTFADGDLIVFPEMPAP